MDCKNCVEHKRCRDSFASWLFFIIALIATISMRLVAILIHVDPLYGKAAWYVGVAGFFMFFVYKFKVNQARSKIIRERNLEAKILGTVPLAPEDRGMIQAIFCSMYSKKDRINYFFIFGLSAVALAVAAYFDFIQK